MLLLQRWLTLDVEGAHQQPMPHAQPRLHFAVARGGWALKRALAALPSLELTTFQVHRGGGIASIECHFHRVAPRPEDAPADEEDDRGAAEFLAAAKRCAASLLRVSVSLEASTSHAPNAERAVEDEEAIEAGPVEGCAKVLLAEVTVAADLLL